jgi:hypothetical protein
MDCQRIAKQKRKRKKNVDFGSETEVDSKRKIDDGIGAEAFAQSAFLKGGIDRSLLSGVLSTLRPFFD